VQFEHFCSLASIGNGQPLCGFSFPLVRGKPLKPLVGRVPTARPLGKCSVGDLQKPCTKQAVNGLLFLLAKKVAKYILPPLTACFLHDNKSAPTGKCSRGFEPPLGAVAKASWGKNLQNFLANQGIIFVFFNSLIVDFLNIFLIIFFDFFQKNYQKNYVRVVFFVIGLRLKTFAIKVRNFTSGLHRSHYLLPFFFDNGRRAFLQMHYSKNAR
jgi:hypothetical protein